MIISYPPQLIGILGGHSAIKLLKLLNLRLKDDFGAPMVSELPARRVRNRFGRKNGLPENPGNYGALDCRMPSLGALFDHRFDTDLFPSHGILVKRDGVVLHKEVVNDASGVPGEGALGAALIGAGLSVQANDGTRNVP